MQNALINKAAAIRKYEDVIRRADAYLALPGHEPEYYQWHENTKAICLAAIKRIKEAPDHEWN